jgi:hypothetical protein
MTIPTPNQIKNVLDGVAAAVLFPVFGWVYQALSAQGCLTAYEVLNEQMLLGLDGTEYLALPAYWTVRSSRKINEFARVPAPKVVQGAQSLKRSHNKAYRGSA